MKIGNRFVGDGESTFVIAEVGSNHDKKLSQAIEMIDIAVDSGADAVKFQLFYASSLWPEESKACSILKTLEINRDWIHELLEHANKRKIMLLATPFDAEAVDLLDKVDIPAYKWASSEIYDLSLLKYAAEKNRPMIIATGACTMKEVENAVNVVQSAENNDIVLLHCVSAYPTKPGAANLRIMDTLKEEFSMPVGFSDHTMGISVPMAAVARGANVIEKHFTLSRKFNGADHSFALEPGELKDMIAGIREVEQSLGSPVKSFIPNAEDADYIVRLFSARDITKGAKLTKDMIVVKRANFGIFPESFDDVLGRKARTDIKADVPITWELI